jgi:F-type H+-transporting ATPase subunit b
MESLIATFHLDWKLMVAQIVNFAIVFTVLYIFALKPLKKLMDERGATIQGGLDNADKQKELLAAQQQEYDAMMAKARADAATLMKEVKGESEAYRAEAMEKAHGDVATLVAGGRAQLEADKAEMLGEAKKEIVSLVMSATEKVLGTAVTVPVDAKLVEESIKNI